MRNETQEFREKQGSGDQGEGAETESKPALLYFQQWMKEEVGS